MKFESKFGIGEIVAYEPYPRNGIMNDALLEVQMVCFGMDGRVDYLCRYPESGVTVYFGENQLIGDSDFDQIKGEYETDD